MFEFTFTFREACLSIGTFIILVVFLIHRIGATTVVRNLTIQRNTMRAALDRKRKKQGGMRRAVMAMKGRHAKHTSKLREKSEPSPTGGSWWSRFRRKPVE